MVDKFVVIAMVLLIAVAGVAGYLLGHTYISGKTVTTTTVIYGQLGVKLGLSANESISAGKNETITISFTNQWPYVNNATYEGFIVASKGPPLSESIWGNYVLPIPPVCDSFLGGKYPIPFFIAIYNQSGDALQLNAAPPVYISCLYFPHSDSHVFGPSQTVNETISVGGSWSSSSANEPWINATYKPFTPGAYAIAVFDPWNQLLQGYTFSVTT